MVIRIITKQERIIASHVAEKIYCEKNIPPVEMIFIAFY